MNIKSLRSATGMTQKAFGDYFSIPLKSIQGWEYNNRKCPPYLLALIEYKLRKEGLLK